MARMTVEIDNVRAVPLGNKNAWTIKFSKRIGGVQRRHSDDFIGTRVEAKEKCEEVREHWILHHEMESRQDTFSLKSANLRDLIWSYYLPAIGRDTEAGYPNKKAWGMRKSFANSMLNSCGNLPIYPGDTKPYFNKFKLDLRRIFHGWKREVGNTTIAMRVRLLRSAFGQLVKDDLISKNPMDDDIFKKVKPNPSRIAEIQTRGDVERLLKVIQQERPHIYPIMVFALQIPMRKSELIALEKKYMSLEKMQIRIPKHLSKNGCEIIKSIPENMREYFSSIPKESNYIFYRRIGGTKKRSEVTYLPLGDFKKAFNWCKKLAGFPRAVFHDTRHYSVTSLEDAGNSKRAIMAEAGWKTARMFEVYRNQIGGNKQGELTIPANIIYVEEWNRAIGPSNGKKEEING